MRLLMNRESVRPHLCGALWLVGDNLYLFRYGVTGTPSSGLDSPECLCLRVTELCAEVLMVRATTRSLNPSTCLLYEDAY